MATRYVWNKHHRDSYTYYTEDMRSIQSGFSVSSAKGSSYGEIVYYSQKKLDPSTGEFSLTGRNTAIGMATGYAKYNNGCIYADFEYTHNDTVIAADNVISYTAKANTGYEKGSLIGPVSNAGSSAYPSNNYSGDYWYQSQGNDVIDPDDVSIPSDILGGNTIEITLTPSTGKVYGGTVSYTYQYRLDGGEWQTLATTTETTQQLLVPAGTNTIEVQVRAQDDIGFTSPTWVASSMEHVTNNQPPTAPGSIQVTNVTTGQEAAVTLTAATDPDGTVESYIYERSVDGGAFQPFANVNALTQTDHISGDWGTVAYRACAVDDDGAAGPYVTSETKTVTTGLVTIAGPAADLGEKPMPFAFWFRCGVSDQTAVQGIAVRVTVDGKDFFNGTLPGQALDGQIPQGQPLHLISLLGGAAHPKAAAHQQSVRGCLAEVLLLVVVGETGPHRAVMLDHKTHGGFPDGVHVRAVPDKGGGIHPHLTAQAGDVGRPLALGGQGLLDGVGCGGVCAPLALRGAGGSAVSGGSVDDLLAAVKLGLFLGGEAAALGAGLVHQGLLTGKCFGFVHAVVTSFCSG